MTLRIKSKWSGLLCLGEEEDFEMDEEESRDHTVTPESPDEKSNDNQQEMEKTD